MATDKNSTDKKEDFAKNEPAFRDWIKADPHSKFPAAKGRYHLYVSYACPFASRTLIFRSLKGLEDVISCDVVSYLNRLGSTGWNFDKEFESTGDSLYGCKFVSELYEMSVNTSGPQSVPILWDKETKTIVNNESSEIIRMLNSEFNDFCATKEQRNLDLYPECLRGEIDSINEWVCPKLNNGVYKTGFTVSQEVYEEACDGVFEALDKVESILGNSRYITGDQLTVADVRLFVTLIRFDPVYALVFRCSRKRLVDYPNAWAYTRDLHQMPAIKSTVNMQHIRNGYFTSPKLNPSGIVFKMPDSFDLEAGHKRAE